MSEKVPVTIDDLKQIPILEGLPDKVLKWILDRAGYMEFEDGAVMYRTGEPIDDMWLLVEGIIQFYMDVNGRLVHYFTFGHEPPAKGVGGLLPYSRMKTSPGWTYAQGHVKGVSLHKRYFRDLEHISPELIQRLIANMTERARFFATRKLQDEKISALGKLSAGLAHELNNPAAAIQRTVTELAHRVKNNYELTSELLKENVTSDEVNHVYELVTRQAETPRDKKQSLMQKMAREDELVDKIGSYGFPDPQTLAETMNDAGIDVDALEEIHKGLSDKTFVPVMKWLCNILISSRVIKEVEDASSRISTLVTAMKSHVHMDRSVAMQPVDIHEGIDNTLTLLNHKIKKKNIRVDRQYDEHLPEVTAYGGELNQVWSNLIDNAIDAMDQEGRLTITTKHENEMVKISIIDNGPGIPEEIRNQIFDPFFTTKKQGEGTGIGLDLVKQIANRHHGEVKLFSKPGRTEFQVVLHVNPPEEEHFGIQNPTE